ncbi:protein PIMREG isoform X2 [Microcaecilia unicolor]|uniref:Protein PIMREG isoform X2 n=1 Tax=Microcaecilia unicolor TaxID=1415580 RepID=A0A6P7ZX66_9AMPH|nr:protein PIMREG isoform X2 [Microcaecilia unicolor]
MHSCICLSSDSQIVEAKAQRYPQQWRKKKKLLRDIKMTTPLPSVGIAVSWRNHQVLENFDENDSPKPDNFKKIPSSSSLNTIRMSVRKRLPLKQLDIKLDENPTWESLESKEKWHPLKKMTRTTKNAFGSVSQKIQKTCQNPSEYLLTSPAKAQGIGKQSSCIDNGANKTASPRTPGRKTSKLIPTTNQSSSTKVTPRSSKQFFPKPGSGKDPKHCEDEDWKSISHWVGKDGLRRSVRTAALKSPYSSPATISKIRQFDVDLESVSLGIHQLKRLSRVFDDAIQRKESDMTVSLISN